MPYDSSELFKDGMLYGLLNVIPTRTEYGVILGYSVGSSVVSSVGFNYYKIDGTHNIHYLGG